MMFKPILFLITMTFATPLNGQTTKEIFGIDTLILTAKENEGTKSLGVTKLTAYRGDSAFRFNNSRQYVEILFDKFSIKGRIISYASAYKDKKSSRKQKKSPKRYSRCSVIDSLNLVKISKLINDSKILTIPTGDSIKEWKLGFDGITYEFEYTNNETYTFKSYWTPQVQDSGLIEARQVLYFISKATEILKLETEFNTFTNKLPVGEYLIGTMTVLHKTCNLKCRLKRFWKKL